MSFMRSQNQSFPSHWQVVPFEEAFDDMTGGNAKIQTRDYLPQGVLPVVDQGKAAVAGYVNDVTLACKTPLPCILFGDHTRLFKYQKRPFALGADGVKVLVPRAGLHARFALHFLQTVRLPEDLGYSRHFKYLKEARVPRPPLAEQTRIAAVLDKADAIRRKRKESIALTEELLRSAFLEMFGDPVTNPKRWPVKSFGQLLAMPLRNGLSPSSSGKHAARVLTLSAITRRSYDPNAWKDGVFAVEPWDNVRVDQRDFLICRGNGNKEFVGRGAFPTSSDASLVFPDTMIAARTDDRQVAAAYIASIWISPSVREQLEASARTTNGTFKVNQGAVEAVQIMTPPREKQEAFQALALRITQSTARQEDARDAAETLFDSLITRAFAGELGPC